MRQGAKGTVSRRVAVTANNGHARQRPSLLWPYNAVRCPDAHQTRDSNECQSLQRFCQVPRLGYGFLRYQSLLPDQGWWAHCGLAPQLFFRCADLASGHAQPFKGLRACHLVHKVAVNIQKACSIFGFMGHMGIPYFIIECFRGGHCHPLPVRVRSHVYKEFKQVVAPKYPAVRHKSAKASVRGPRYQTESS